MPRGGKRSTSWKPGQSGNPKGGPKWGESFAEILRRELGKAHNVKNAAGEIIRKDGKPIKVVAREIMAKLRPR